MSRREQRSLLAQIQQEILDTPPLRERFHVPKDSRREKHREKSVAEYTAQDMAMVFQDAWNKLAMSARPKRWTARDFKHAKDLIEEQGPETTVKLIQYVLGNWPALVKRYGVRGYPQMSVIFGFRGSWVPEAVDGVQAEAKVAAEFSGSEVASGQWE